MQEMWGRRTRSGSTVASRPRTGEKVSGAAPLGLPVGSTEGLRMLPAPPRPEDFGGEASE